MTAQQLAQLHAAGRIVIGSALWFAPRRAGASWVGSDQAASTGSRLFAAAMGARDAGLGAGQLAAARRGTGVRPWILAGLVADATDCVATLSSRDQLPRTAPATAALAAASVLAGVCFAATLD